MHKIIGLICGIIGLIILLYPPSEGKAPAPAPANGDKVSQAFEIYESLWRSHNQTAADKIRDGELKTEQQIWDFIAAGQAPARKVAFDTIAKSEQEYFDKNGGWSLKNHETLLRSYRK